jgi:hypothetical protein
MFNLSFKQVISYLNALEKYYYYFGSNEVWTQGFMLGRLALYYMSHTPQLFFATLIFWIGSLRFLLGVGLRPWSSYPHLPHSWDHRHTSRWLLGWEGGLSNFLPRLALNLDPSNLSWKMFILTHLHSYSKMSQYFLKFHMLHVFLKHAIFKFITLGLLLG